jgi:hypothetical protein
MRSQVDQGRACKRATNWDEWQKGTAHFAEACELASALASKVEQSIGGAKQYERERKSKRRTWATFGLGTGIGIAGSIVTFFLA